MIEVYKSLISLIIIFVLAYYSGIFIALIVVSICEKIGKEKENEREIDLDK